MLLGVLLFVALLLPAAARAGSALRLPLPGRFGSVPAATYDESGRRVGDAHLVIERLEGGRIRLFAESGIRDAERNVMKAVLEPIQGDDALRLVHQNSRSFDAAGAPMGEMSIDHAAGRGRCVLPDGQDHSQIALPRPDRVANVPVNLLFLPLVKGERREVAFQLLLCSGGARLIEATAAVAGRRKTQDGLRDIVEVRYEVDFGSRWLSALARPFLPRMAVWFDPEQPDAWLAHRMPLFAKGPTVLVVRTGVAPGALDEDTP